MYAETGESAQAGPGAGTCCGWGCGGGGRWKTGLLWLGLGGTAWWWLGWTGGGRATGVAIGGGRILWRRMEGGLGCDCGGGGRCGWWYCGGGGGDGDGVPAVSCWTMSRNWFLLML
jgi:hypothetical protein